MRIISFITLPSPISGTVERIRLHFHLPHRPPRVSSSRGPPMEVIRAATLHGARFLGSNDRFGSFEEGKVADFLVLNANPPEDIRNTRQIHQFWMDGRTVERRALADR